LFGELLSRATGVLKNFAYGRLALIVLRYISPKALFDSILGDGGKFLLTEVILGVSFGPMLPSPK
jgi:hypothetical protein